MRATTFDRTARIVGLTLTTALATATLAGCSAKVAPPASASAVKAESALAKGKGDKAVTYAESAVLAAPRDADLRALLGSAYIEAGRFESAAATLAEAQELGDMSQRTIVSLALAQIASGQQQAALQTLDAHETDLDPADFGLAVALAGQPQRGVLVLGNQLRFGENSPKVRQNLAYAYALKGDWRSARLMAAEDVPADKIGERMAHWGQMANPAYFRHRVADLLGVEMVQDPGQPARLALAHHPSLNQLAAEVASPASPAPKPVFAMRGELPPVAGQGAEAASAPIPAAAARTVAQSFGSPEAPAPRVAAATPARVAAPAAAAKRAPEPKPSTGFVAQSGDYRVQLGSYFSMSDAQQAWKVFQQRHPELAGAEKVITKAKVKGKMYYRVAAAGYAEASARSLCSLVKKGGGGCIAYAANNPLPGALESNVRMASR
ncbi:MAG: SPOR domain-containing protein [Erythrobacter sp.]|nr:SPOR domain-containing protein [Erythrobacter sp.]